MFKLGFHPLAKRGELAEARELVAKIEHIPGAPEEAVSRYYNVDLPRLIDLGRHHPRAVKKLLRRSLESSPRKEAVEPWYRLVEAARGNPEGLLNIFEQGDIKQKLALFRITLYSPHVGDGHLVGELFVKLMEQTTHAEREQWVEPTLNSILNRGAWARHPNVQNKINWLKALYHGWLEEAKEFV
ncbi:MAG: hypothetical protein HY609_03995 [Deltaproteobacteria bacterium]|nr:hypothetical protein [Deltaproteobacteria bacterium]MBI4224070.1 hypothetical protein [Deltaproteobacteria bacterium]